LIGGYARAYPMGIAHKPPRDPGGVGRESGSRGLNIPLCLTRHMVKGLRFEFLGQNHNS